MATPTRVGEIIAGKYRVERVIGRGGMGVVVVGRHLRLGERVAIKFPIAHSDTGSERVARLIREGRAAMRIRSEHVVRVFDVGITDTCEPYLVMEYLVGRDLGAIVASEGPLPIEAAAAYVLQATEALAEAHASGLIHRDLKPSNLFLTHHPDGSPWVKVLDFGVAKSTRSHGEVSLTHSNEMIGSPLYMAPEQMRSPCRVDPRTDIWGLGVTLYALLTGGPPFPAASIVEIHELIQRGAPRLRVSRPDAPAPLEAVILRCLQKEPLDRYVNVAELAAALAEVAPADARISAVRAARILNAARLPGDRAAVSDGVAGAAFPDASSETAEITGAPLEASWWEGGPTEVMQRPGAGGSLSVVTTTPTQRPVITRPRALVLAGAVAASSLVPWVMLGAHATGSVPDPSSAAALASAIPMTPRAGASPSARVPEVPSADALVDRDVGVCSTASTRSPTPLRSPASRVTHAARDAVTLSLPSAVAPTPAGARPRDPFADPD